MLPRISIVFKWVCPIDVWEGASRDAPRFGLKSNSVSMQEKKRKSSTVRDCCCRVYSLVFRQIATLGIPSVLQSSLPGLMEFLGHLLIFQRISFFQIAKLYWPRFMIRINGVEIVTINALSFIRTMFIRTVILNFL